MKKAGRALLILVLAAGYLILLYVAYKTASEAWALSREGVEKQALVVRLERKHWATRGGTTWFYKLDIEGRKVTEGFRQPLPVGESVSLLVLPQVPGIMSLGDEDSTWLDVVAAEEGGYVWAVLILAFEAAVFLSPPLILVALWRATRPRRRSPYWNAITRA